MKNGAEYARRIRRVFNRLQRTEGKPAIGPPTDPIEQLAVSILGVSSSQEQGRKAFRRLLKQAVDINEVRVSSPGEIATMIKDAVPQTNDRAKALVGALNAVYHAESEMSLASLTKMKRREARHYLEGLGNIDPYTIASILLWSLGGHAIPVSDRLLAAFRADDLVTPECNVAEVQSFLERHVSATDGPRFCLLMETYAQRWDRSGSSRRTAKGTTRKAKPPAKRAAKKTRKATAKSSASSRKKAKK